MLEDIIDHDASNQPKKKSKKASAVVPAPIHGVLPFKGVRNPTSRSASSHRSWFAYSTPANDWVPEVGMVESDAELACAFEALIEPTTHHLTFQPFSVPFVDEDGRRRTHTHDLLIVRTDGHRRLVFVRNEASLLKPRTQREIEAIVKATPPDRADDLIVVNASDYTRPRRENLRRMYWLVQQPDDEADQIVLLTARRLRTLWQVKDLFPLTGIAQHRTFRSVYRLVARRLLVADLDAVLFEHSRIEVAA